MSQHTRFYISFGIILFLLLIPISTHASAAVSPFAGEWQAVDVDGSDIRLAIAGPPGGPFKVTWTESYFSFCGGEAGIARGTGHPVEEDLLTADLHLVCFTTGDSVDFQITWIYDQGTDTLNSDFITWHRPNAASKTCLPSPSGLTGWWPSDGSAADLVSGRDGFFQGDASSASGLVDLSFRLDGDGDFVEVPHDPALNVGVSDFTIDLWVNFTNTAGEQVLVEKWIQGEPSLGWSLTKLEDNTLRLAMASINHAEVDVDSQPLELRAGLWYHFAAVRHGSAVTLYGNGALIAQDYDAGAINLNSDASLKFGHRGGPDEGGFSLNGRIDEVELFAGTALSQEQILSLYMAGSAGKCKDTIQRPPELNLRVNYGHDWVESFYEAGHTVWIMVTGDDSFSVKATAKLFTEPKDFWGGETGFQTAPEDWDPAPPDIQAYDWVYAWVDNGVSALVQIGDIQGQVSYQTDSITGSIDAPWITDPVPVECLDWGSGQEQPYSNKDGGFVLTNNSDPYSCSWAGEWDIQPYQNVGVGYTGSDGHWVANAFIAPANPRFTVFPLWEWYDAMDWPGGAMVAIRVEGKPQCDLEKVSPGNFFNGGFPAGCDIAAGDTVTYTDGATTRSHMVRNLAITTIDLEEDTISGIADAGTPVYVWPHDGWFDPLQAVADDSGMWQVDLGSMGYDIQEGASGRSEIRDEMGNATAVDWSLNPRLIVHTMDDWFRAEGFMPNTSLDFWIYDSFGGNLLLESTTTPTDSSGTVTHWVGNQMDIVPGNYVVVSDGTSTRDIVLEALTFDVFDTSLGLLQGTAPEPFGRTVSVGIGCWARDDLTMDVTTDENGAWTADFGVPVPNDFGCVFAWVYDENGNVSEARPAYTAGEQP